MGALDAGGLLSGEKCSGLIPTTAGISATLFYGSLKTIRARFGKFRSGLREVWKSGLWAGAGLGWDCSFGKVGVPGSRRCVFEGGFEDGIV